MRKKVKRNIACLLLFAQIFFSAFAPLSFLIQSASAQQNQEQQSPQAVLSFAHEADSALSVHNHSADELEYRLYYLHQGLVQKITGELTASQQNVLFLGTQSGEHFTGHSWDRMVFQVSDPNGWSRKYWLVRTDNQITTERFTNIDQLGLSTNDRQWLTWQIDEAAMRAVTFQNVVAFQTYTFPLNDKVQITFTQLPEESSPLAIGQIELSDELAERYGTDVAFDITTDMENGEFEFDLSLPKPEGVEGDEVEVIYADSEEDLADESKVSKVETERDGDEDEGVVRVKGVEHLTVFVVVPEDILSNNSLQYYFQQGWRMTSFGNASIELVDVGAIPDVPNLVGLHSVRMMRDGGPGYNRAFLGYYKFGKTLNTIDHISWNQFSFTGVDSYLNIFIRRPFSTETATIVFNPPTESNEWIFHLLNIETDSSNLSIRRAGVTTDISFSDLLNNYGNWVIDNHLDCSLGDSILCFLPRYLYAIGGIVIVSGSSNPTDPQDHIIDGVTIKFTSDETGYFDFVEEEPFQPNIPEQIGYNVNDGSPIDARPTQYACEGGFTNVNNVSVHWEDVAGGNPNIKYQRQYSRDGINWSPNVEYYTSPYTDYRSFGYGEVIHYSRVLAFYDVNANGKLDVNEPASDWSDVCGITYDKTPPIVEITSVEDGEYYRRTIDFKGTIIEENLQDYRLRVRYMHGNDPLAVYNSGWVTSATDFTNELLYTWDSTTSQYGDGRYNIRLDGRDKAGNTSSHRIYIYVDNTRPEVEILSPTEFTYTNDYISFNGRAKDENLRRIFLGLGDEDGNILRDENNNRVLCSTLQTADIENPNWNEISCTDFDLGNYPEGIYSMVLESWDMSWNYRKAYVLFELDRTAPVVTIDQQDLITRNITPTLTGTIDDPEAVVVVELDSTEYMATNNEDGSWTLDIGESLGDKTYLVIVTATDLADNSSSVDTTLTIDNRMPRCSEQEFSYYINGELLENSFNSCTGQYDPDEVVYAQTLGDFTFSAELIDSNYSGEDSPAGLDKVRFYVFKMNDNPNSPWDYQQSMCSGIYDEWDGELSGTLEEKDFSGCPELEEGLYRIGHMVYQRETGGVNNPYGDYHGIYFIVDKSAPSTPIMTHITRRDTGDTVLNCSVNGEIENVGYTNTPQIRIHWEANQEDDLDGYWFGVLGRMHHQKMGINSTYKNGNMSPGREYYRYFLSAFDKAGNESVAAECGDLILDMLPPHSEIQEPSDQEVFITNEWDGSLAGIAWEETSSDYPTASGVSEVRLIIARNLDEGTDYWNDADWQFSETYVLASSDDDFANWDYEVNDLSEATYIIQSQAVDRAGNVEETDQLVIILDKTIPEVDLTIDPEQADGSGSWYVTRPTLNLTATDPSNSGLKHLQYQWNSKSDLGWTTIEAKGTNLAEVSTQPPKEGHSILYYRASDLAGNTLSETGVKNVRWDQTNLTEGPLNVKADPNPTSGSTSTISWDHAKDNIGINRYRITWELRDGDDTHSKTVNAETTSTTISDLKEGTYKVTVRAYDHADHYKQASTDLVVDRTAPSAPVLTLDSTGEGTASLSWTESEDAVGYIIFYGLESGNHIYAARVGNVTSFTVEGLATGTYYFVVRAVDHVDNQSPNSNEVNTGEIIGVAAVGPAVGFAEVGEVLGEETDIDEELLLEEEQELADEVEGEVLGVTTDCGFWLTNLAPIVLAGQLIILLVIEIKLRSDSSPLKYFLAVGTTALAIGAYYLLRNNDCFVPASNRLLLSNWFWLVSALTAVLTKIINYLFIEIVE